MKCRHCGRVLKHVFIDLGCAPPSNSYLKKDDLHNPEVYFPLRVFVCNKCWLVQTEDFAAANQLFRSDYAYFSSVSSSWLRHAALYAEDITKKLSLDRSSFVIEIASNDGYLLRNFVERGIPCLGIEPASDTARAAERLGIPVVQKFFGSGLAQELAAEGRMADLLVGNNVLAHVPDINDFVKGLKVVLKPAGSITMEFPHLLELIRHMQFDTIYHEHFSYLSLGTVRRIFEKSGLRVFHVESLSTHGGSLRIYACHENDGRRESPSVQALLEEEKRFGLWGIDVYKNFQEKAESIKNKFVMYLIEQKRLKRSVAAYGAAAKGNTLLNYSGIRSDLLPYVCDGAPSKQGKFLPGSRIPIVSPEKLRERKPQTVIVFPWNIVDEVVQRHCYVGEWGGRFVTVVPELKRIEPLQ
ncbi:MAG: SAM-dependent methyltransferase [Dethiosulfovibrio peptidovorans]|nr:MAG: SAM-dependent methyltransferase [Dethiosulfovibrio peptidovorans]